MRRLQFTAFAMAVACLALVQLEAEQGRLGYYRFPAIWHDTIVFTAEGDLWRVPVTGGVAQRLTTHPALESDPAISPDGLVVAFDASVRGSAEVYTVSLQGGVPQRQTWEAAAPRSSAGHRTAASCTRRSASRGFRTISSRRSIPVRMRPRAVPLAQAAMERTTRTAGRCTSRASRSRAATRSATRAAPRSRSGNGRATERPRR